jgi:hypothetical protein
MQITTVKKTMSFVEGGHGTAQQDVGRVVCGKKKQNSEGEGFVCGVAGSHEASPSGSERVQAGRVARLPAQQRHCPAQGGLRVWKQCRLPLRPALLGPRLAGVYPGANFILSCALPGSLSLVIVGGPSCCPSEPMPPTCMSEGCAVPERSFGASLQSLVGGLGVCASCETTPSQECAGDSNLRLLGSRI